MVKKFGFKAVWVVKVAVGLLLTKCYLSVVSENGLYQFVGWYASEALKVILGMTVVYFALESFTQVYWAIKIIFGGEEAIAEINLRFLAKSN